MRLIQLACAAVLPPFVLALPSSERSHSSRSHNLAPRASLSFPIERVPSTRSATSLRKRQDLHSNARVNLHAVSITLGGQAVKLYLDTGSSNIWLIDTDFQCIDIDGHVISKDTCRFVDSGFDVRTAGGAKIDPSFFNTGYAGGEYMIGVGWTSDAEFNGVTIKDQIFGVVDRAHWAGDGYTSGLFGLGSLYTNQIYTNSSTVPVGDDSRVVFPNPVTEAWKQGLSNEYHTLALNRVPFDDEHDGVQPAGYLALGGVPDDIKVTGKSATVPLIKWTVGANGAYIDEQAWSAPDWKSTFTFPGSEDITQELVTPNMDTGASGIGLPTAVYNAYTPQIANASCDGSGMPPLAWNVNGVDFYFDPLDLLNKQGPNDCYFQGYDAGATGAAL
ncbi:hypothetical protein I317_06359 [Kwoniella heveanensis CBS 569]|nr:hypothetical protein I317_06359 [Kwoniella heveanensis CBS 569]